MNLKPCEHCGGEGALAVVRRFERTWAVLCLGCQVETAEASLEEAVREWNDQPYADSLRAQLAEVSALLQSLRESSIADFNSRGGIQIDPSEPSEKVKEFARALSREWHVVKFGLNRAANHARSSGWCAKCIRQAVPEFSVPSCDECGNRACANPECEYGCFCEREGLGKCCSCGNSRKHVEAKGGKLNRIHLEDGTVEYCCEGCIPF